MEEIAVKKLKDNTWTIEKTGRMNVPVIIYASDKILESIKQDKTLEQAKNMASMPGVEEYIVVLPDAHQGYGACIGGVAGYNAKSGVISPGEIGYDINCLTGDSKILTEFGQSIKIEEFNKHQSEIYISEGSRKIKQIQLAAQLTTLNIADNILEPKKINLFMSRKSSDVYQLNLASGLKIEATGDHPFLTKQGMRILSHLTKGDEVGVHLFEGIGINEEIDEKEAIIAKLFGYMLGDGCFYESKGVLSVVCYGSRDDLKNIQNDLERIGVNSNIYSRKRNHMIRTKYGEKRFTTTNHELHIHSKPFKELLKSLGMPLGNKTRQELKIPEWIKRSNRAIKRLFLAGFFGAELSTPKTSSKTCFYCPTVDHNKIESLRQNARDFLIDIALLLEEFGIDDYCINEMDDFENRYQEKTKRFRLIIKREENILKLWRNIGFEYNAKRKRMADIASLYLLLKHQEHKKRGKIANKIKAYRKKGLGIGEVKRILKNNINERFIERHFYENIKQRINLDFVDFNEFYKKKLEETSVYGCIFDYIKDITKIYGEHDVYDFNIQDNHNFIANGFIVSNCGVRLLATNLIKKDFLPQRKEILHAIYRAVPSGVGHGGEIKVSDKELDDVLNRGVQGWALEKGYATKEDIEHIEDQGKIEGADAGKVSQRAKSRGRGQIGTLGAGNHFLEVQEVETIYDKKIAGVYGLYKNQIVVMIHTGSRGLGHQTASDYIQKMERAYGWQHLPDRELICAPIDSVLGQEYRAAMAAAANFAFTNRQLITYHVRNQFQHYFPRINLNLVYDIAHNIAKFEKYNIGGKNIVLCVHRKGATRSFGPGRKEIPRDYKNVGCPIFIPGSMGTFSYVLAGTKEAEKISFASTAHGAGRVMSRNKAVKELSRERVLQELKTYNVEIEAGSMKGVVEEAPEAYKDVNEVVRVSHELGIGTIVARLKPLGVVKG